MASAAEQLASNISLSSFSKATELKTRLWFTLGALILFRLLSFVPMPGIDPGAMASLYQTQSGGVLDFFNTFSGGALERMSIVALGVMPYITASIVVQLGGSIELIERKEPAELAAAKKGKAREARIADKAAKQAKA
jgi:preprotein translocase subunit SecY